MDGYRLSGVDELIEVTLERAAKRKLMELDGKIRPPSAAQRRKAEARRRVEQLREQRAVELECANVWD
ncbi:MAG: hypothetical protein ACRCUH_08895 [Shewanella sp.]